MGLWPNSIDIEWNFSLDIGEVHHEVLLLFDHSEKDTVNQF